MNPPALICGPAPAGSLICLVKVLCGSCNLFLLLDVAGYSDIKILKSFHHKIGGGDV